MKRSNLSGAEFSADALPIDTLKTVIGGAGKANRPEIDAHHAIGLTAMDAADSHGEALSNNVWNKSAAVQSEHEDQEALLGWSRDMSQWGKN